MRSLLSLAIPLNGSVQDVCCNGDRLCKGKLALCSWKARQKVQHEGVFGIDAMVLAFRGRFLLLLLVRVVAATAAIDVALWSLLVWTA